MLILTDDPNFSVVIPGCSQKCRFCFHNDKLTKADDRHKLSLSDTIEALPANFHQISITGGEPMEHPRKLISVINTIRPFVDSGKIDKIVITSNGTNIKSFLKILHNNRDLPICVNISRHRAADTLNEAIFNGGNARHSTMIATRDDLKAFTSESVHPVSINMVLHRDNEDPWSDTWLTIGTFRVTLQVLSELGVQGITVRVEHGSLEPHGYENACRYLMRNYRLIKTGCPVCVSNLYVPANNAAKFRVPVTFKYSRTLPLEELGGIYELIYHPNGIVSPMWDGSNPLTKEDILLMSKTRMAELRKIRSNAVKEMHKVSAELERLKQEVAAAEESLEEEELKHMPPAKTPNNRWKPIRERGGSCSVGGFGGC